MVVSVTHRIYRLQKALTESYSDFDERIQVLLDTLVESGREIVCVAVHNIYATVVVRTKASNQGLSVRPPETGR
jgi:hypothetical protein